MLGIKVISEAVRTSRAIGQWTTSPVALLDARRGSRYG